MRALLPYAAVGVGIYVFESAWAAILLYHGGIVLLARGEGLRAIRRPALRADAGFALLLVACAAAGPLVALLQPWMAAGAWSTALSALGLEGPAWWVFMAYFALVHPPLEQLFWRGLTDGRGTLCIEDALFAGYHALVLVRFVTWPWLVVSVLVLALASMAWRRLRNRCGGLAAPALTHAAADASIIIAVQMMRGT